MQTTECLRQACRAGSDSYRRDPASFYFEIFYIYQVTFIATVTPVTHLYLPDFY